MSDPFAVGAAAAGALVRVIGDAWTPTITFQQADGQPFDLSSVQSVGGDFYVEGCATPLATLTPTIATPANGQAAFVIPATLTAQAPERDPDFACVFPTRLVGWYVDSLGRRHSDALVLYCPVQAGHARALPPQDDGVTVVVGQPGPAGPQGLSAYQMYQQGGGQLDEATWLAGQGSGGLVSKAVAVTIAQVGQTVIPLSDPPQLLSSVALEVNGISYRGPVIAVSTIAVTWSGDFRLEPSDTVVLSYT